jgi:hypothetical protein
VPSSHSPPEPRSGRAPGALTGIDVLVSLIVAANFAVAGPVLDFLGRNMDVFAVRASPRADVVAVALLLTVGIPAALGMLVAVLHRVARRIGVLVHALLLTALLSLLALRLLDGRPSLSARPAALLAVALAAAVAGVVLYLRSSSVRSFVRVGVVAPVGFLLLFALFTPARGLLAPAYAEEAAAAVLTPTPVVLVMFDGLPVVSLLDARERVDARLFPHFARLQEEATWFRNATSHSPSTRSALPGMFSGRHAKPSEARDTRTLFELLPDEYRIVAYEPLLRLCPEERCDTVVRRAPWRERWPRLARDVGLLGLHALAPDAVRDRLPPAEDALGAFAGGRPDHDVDDDEGHHAAWDWFLAELRPDDRDALHFFHWMKPHWPWLHLPTGQASAPPPAEPHGGYVFREWEDDWLRTAQWQRQLLQVGYVDLLLGQLLEALEDAGTYDDTLLVVASDHGEAFTVGEPIRAPTTGNLGELAYVTLFVKEPGQREGRVVDAPAELVDVLPTVADVLGLEVPGPLDGRSLRDELPARRDRRFAGWDEDWPLDAALSDTGEERRDPLRRKLARFGSVGGWERLFAVGAHGDLVGASLEQLAVERETFGTVRVADLERLDEVDPAAARIPNLVTGRLRADTPLDGPLPVAVALDGRVVTVVDTYRTEGTAARVFAVLPPDALAPGRNALELFAVEGAGEQRRLRRLEVTPD